LQQALLANQIAKSTIGTQLHEDVEIIFGKAFVWIDSHQIRVLGKHLENCDFPFDFPAFDEVATIGDDLDSQLLPLIFSFGRSADNSEAALSKFGIAVNEKFEVISLERAAHK
jgi:hypothetical protein